MEKFYPSAGHRDEDWLRANLNPGDVVKVHVGTSSTGVRTCQLKEDLEPGVFLAEVRKIGQPGKGQVVVARIENIIQVIYFGPGAIHDEEPPVSGQNRITNPVSDLKMQSRQSRVAAIGSIMASGTLGSMLNQPFHIPKRRCVVKDDEGSVMAVNVDRAQPPFYWGELLGYIEHKGGPLRKLGSNVSFAENSILHWDD